MDHRHLVALRTLHRLMSKKWPRFYTLIFRSEISIDIVKNEKSRSKVASAFRRDPGSDLLSHTKNHAVPSAQKSLTTEFEMGSGVTSSLRPPRIAFESSQVRSPNASSNRTIYKERQLNLTQRLLSFAHQVNGCPWKASRPD